MAESKSNILGKIELNQMPDLSMAEITKQLFNNEFMSDVEFRIDGKVLFAHSWELMKRSVVFHNQMRTIMGENKLIPIEDTSYDVFYQFIRFIYTDVCEINEINGVELIKMARKYKISILETKVINLSKVSVKLFEYCVLEKYDTAYQMIREKISADASIIKNDRIINIHPNVMEDILKFDRLANLKEHELFEILVNWINRSSEINQIPLEQRRSHFDKFIRLIRFPAMNGIEFSLCVQQHNDLLANDEILEIFKRISHCPDSSDSHSVWNSKPRLYNEMYNNVEKYYNQQSWSTQFSVSNNVTLNGVRYGIGDFNDTYGLEIIARDPKLNLTDNKYFKFVCLNGDSKSTCILLNLGESIILKPNFEYTMNLMLKLNYFYKREVGKEVILSGPPDVIQNLVATGALYELIYKET